MSCKYTLFSIWIHSGYMMCTQCTQCKRCKSEKGPRPFHFTFLTKCMFSSTGILGFWKHFQSVPKQGIQKVGYFRRTIPPVPRIRFQGTHVQVVLIWGFTLPYVAVSMGVERGYKHLLNQPVCTGCKPSHHKWDPFSQCTSKWPE